MSRPRIVYFGWELTPTGPRPKVYLRCLLFSTGKRGRVIQSMYIRIKRGGKQAVFSVWSYGDRKELMPGSGLFVSQEGVAYNHHFLSNVQANFDQIGFSSGTYSIEVFVDLLNQRKHKKIGEATILLSDEVSSSLYRDGRGVLFDWDPVRREYCPEIDPRADPMALAPPPPLIPGL